MKLFIPKNIKRCIQFFISIGFVYIYVFSDTEMLLREHKLKPKYTETLQSLVFFRVKSGKAAIIVL